MSRRAPCHRPAPHCVRAWAFRRPIRCSPATRAVPFPPPDPDRRGDSMTATAQPAHVILNVNVLDVGIAPSAWTLGDVPAGAFVDAGHFVQAARTAERGTLDALFLA